MEKQGSEYQALVKRLEKLADDGVVDVKFCLRQSEDGSVEDACREVNQMLQALEDGETELVEAASLSR